MNTWKHQLKIKHLLTDDDSPENAQKIGADVAGIIRRSRWYKNAKEWVQDDLEYIAEQFDGVEDVDDFNEVLGALYDVADADRAWIS